MAEQDLNDAAVDAIVQQATGKRVTQTVRGGPFIQAGQFPGLLTGALHQTRTDVAVRTPGGEQPLSGRADDAKVGAQGVQQNRRQGGVAVFSALAVLDAQEHALAFDVGDFEGDGFGNTQPGAETDHEGGTILDAGNVLKEAADVVGAGHHGKFFLYPCTREVGFVPGHFQSGQIEEPHGGNEGVDTLGRQFPFLQQVELV
jgi:hypothetical protein